MAHRRVGSAGSGFGSASKLIKIPEKMVIFQNVVHGVHSEDPRE